MARIGGNTTLTLYRVDKTGTNAIGERTTVHVPVAVIIGWLDMASGETRYGTYHAKIEESSHIFVADWVDVAEYADVDTVAEVNGKRYDVKAIDDPMGLRRHIEIMLDYKGA